MIDVFKSLGWLNAIDNCSHLTAEAQRLIRVACRVSLSTDNVKRILERLRNLGKSSPDPLETAEIALHCAAIEQFRGWLPEAARHAERAVAAYQGDDHRHAVSLWILGMIQWDMRKNCEAYSNCAEARSVFQDRQLFFQHLAKERDWYRNELWQMELELAARPEEVLTWLNCFEASSLRLPSQQIVTFIQKKICQEAYPTIYALMQDLQRAYTSSKEAYERAEVYLEFGLAFYQVGNIPAAIDLLRKSVEHFFPGIGTYHKQAVARCMLGALEWMDNPPYDQAAAHWKRGIEDFDNLSRQADRDNNQTKKEWYTERRDILRAVLAERSL